MKFVTLAFLVALSSGLYVSAEKLDLRPLGFVLWGKHGEGDKTAVASGCPLGALPKTVLLHKTYKSGDHFFTWVKPTAGMVTEVVCGVHEVWKGVPTQFLLDFHFVGKPTADSKKFVHLEYVHELGGVVASYLVFEGSGHKAVSMAEFVAGVHELVPGLHSVEGLPGHTLTHSLKLHAAKAKAAEAALADKLDKARDAEAMAVRVAKAREAEAKTLEQRLAALEAKLATFTALEEKLAELEKKLAASEAAESSDPNLRAAEATNA